MALRHMKKMLNLIHKKIETTFRYHFSPIDRQKIQMFDNMPLAWLWRNRPSYMLPVEP